MANEPPISLLDAMPWGAPPPSTPELTVAPAKPRSSVTERIEAAATDGVAEDHAAIELVRMEDLRRSERTMILARGFAIPWALFQVLSYPHTYPEGMESLGLLLIAALAVGNVVAWLAYARADSLRRATIVAIGSLTFDGLVVLGFVWLYAFDPSSALWALLFIVPMEGAIRFQLKGAMLAWAGVTMLYALREVWGSDRYDYDLDWSSVSYRMGIGLLIAMVAGFMARDLTGQRIQLARAFQELRRVDGLRAALVSTLAHDVRNPLTTIRGVHKTLLRGVDRLAPGVVTELLQASDRQAERLERLAIGLLDLARLEQGRLQLSLERLAVADEVTSALSYVEGAHEVEVEIDLALHVRADPQRFQQMIVNLVTNALRYGEAPYRVSAGRDDGQVTITLRDRGPGVPEDQRATLFEPFRAEGANGKGSIGFGLAIVKALVEAHGGRVYYEPDVPRGACFNLVLPAA